MRILRSLCCVTLLSTTSCSTDTVAGEDEIMVFAAASLVDAFTEIGSAFETQVPGTSIEFNFASSSDLATQIIEGAPADVFASADSENIVEIRDSVVPISQPRTFAANSLEIIVESGNPLGIDSLDDLSDPNVLYVTCDESVPIGRYSAETLSRANVAVTPRSYEENVKGIVNKVVLGEADAGIVYRTDVLAAGDRAQGVPIPTESNVAVEYPIVTIGENVTEATKAFFEFVTTSNTARSILERYGFGTA